MKRTCFDLRGKGRFSCTWRGPWVAPDNGLPRSIIMIWAWIYLVWLGTFGLLNNLSLWSLSNFWTQFFLTSHVSKRSLEEAEVTHILSRIWLLQFPSEQLSEYNKLGVFREEWQRSIVFDRTSILSSEQGWCRPNTPYPDVSSVLYGCMCKTRCIQIDRIKIPMVLVHGIHKQKEYCFVCCSNFWPPNINPELMMECKLIAHTTW